MRYLVLLLLLLDSVREPKRTKVTEFFDAMEK